MNERSHPHCSRRSVRDVRPVPDPPHAVGFCPRCGAQLNRESLRRIIAELEPEAFPVITICECSQVLLINPYTALAYAIPDDHPAAQMHKWFTGRTPGDYLIIEK